MRDPIRLSRRLAAVAGFVLPERPFADVGTDHGQLPVSLLLADRVPRVIASDRREQPLSNARRLAEAHQLRAPRFVARLSDGLAHLQPREVATIAICGMGGGLIAQILRRHPPRALRAQRLVLQPNNAPELVRAHLVETGWTLIEEQLVEEGRYLYPILVAEPAVGPSAALSLAAQILGPILIQRRSALWQRWVSQEAARLSAILAQAEARQRDDSESINTLRRRVAIFQSACDSPNPDNA